MMRSFQKQQGASYLIWLIFLGFLGFSIVVGLRLIPIYLESYTVGKILEDVAHNSVDKKRNRHQIWSNLEKRFNIDSVRTVKRENFSFEKEKGKTTISVKYEVRMNLIGNLDGVAVFKHTQTFGS